MGTRLQVKLALAREQGVRITIERPVELAAEHRRAIQQALEEARLSFERQLAAQRDAGNAR